MPRMLSSLEETKRNGGHVIAINPLPEAGLIRFKNPQKARGIIGRGTTIADQFLHIKPGGDLALFQAINALLLAAEDADPGNVLDHDFIDRDTTGFAEFAEHARRIDWTDVLAATGLSRQEIDEVVDRVLASKKIIVCWAMGVTQQKHGVATVREIVNFLMLRGNLGRPGAGVCPVRGHSNVQGDRTMGIWERMPQTLPRCPWPRVRLHSAEPPRARRGGLDSGHARRPREVLHGIRRQLRARHPRQRPDRAGHAQLQPDRTRVDEAQPLPRRLRRDRTHPADAGTQRP